jgi:hypothetical protein
MWQTLLLRWQPYLQVPHSRTRLSPCSLKTCHPRGRTAWSPHWLPPLAKERPHYHSAWNITLCLTISRCSTLIE